MKLTILGTGNAMVTEVYNTCFVISKENDHFLVDAGGGNQILKRLKEVNINWQDIRTIFVTHKHIDHIIGIIWMFRLYCQGLSRGTFQGEITIYAHDEVVEILRTMTTLLLGEKLAKYLDTNVHLAAVTDGETKHILGQPVTFFDIHSTKARQFGFTMLLKEQEKLTCCGDEPYNEYEKVYVEGSKWLLHEAFCLYGQADVFKPYEKHHSTVKDACELAETLHVQNLILYHTEDKNIEKRKELYLEEGRAYYSGNLYVPGDLESFEL